MNSIELKTGRDASQTPKNPGDRLSHSPTQRHEPAGAHAKSDDLQSSAATVAVPGDFRCRTCRRRAPRWFWLIGVVSALGSWQGLLSQTVLGAEDPPAILAPPRNQSVSVEATVVFRVSASGSQPLAMQWRFGESDLPGATNASTFEFICPPFPGSPPTRRRQVPRRCGQRRGGSHRPVESTRIFYRQTARWVPKDGPG